MKHFILVACLSTALISCGDNSKKDDTTVTTTDTANKMETTKADETPAAPVDSATMMKNWQAYATPGPEQAMMAKWNGTWTGKIYMWPAPGAPVDSSMGTAVNKMIYGGRYQQSLHSGNMMGMPFEGQSVTGFDNAKKRFQSSWFDNMGTGISTMEGTWDEATKTLNMSGKMVDASTNNGKEISVRQVTRIIDDNHQVFEMYCNGPDGKEFKTMEISMTRK